MQRAALQLWFTRMAVFGTLLLLVLYLLAWIFEDRLGRVVLDLVRTELRTELEVGEFQLSFIRAFPRIRGSFREVRLMDTRGDTLLEARRLGINMPWSVLWEEVPTLDAVIVEQGQLRLALDKKGQPNYLVFQPRDPKAPEKPFGLDIREAQLRDIRIRYEDLAAKQRLQIRADKATLQGRIREEKLALRHLVKATLLHWEQDFDSPALNIPLASDGILHIDLAARRYTLENTRLEVAGMGFEAVGHWESSGNGTLFNLEGQTAGFQVQDLWKTIGQFYPLTAQSLQPRGQARMKWTVKGLQRGQQWPGIEASLTLEKGRITPPAGPAVEDIRLAVQWSQPPGKTLSQASLRIKQAEALVATRPLQVRGTIQNMLAPVLDLHINGALPVALIQQEGLRGESGILAIQDLHLQGALTRQGLQASGRAEAEQMVFRYYQDPVRLERGSFQLANNLLRLEGLQWVVAGTTLQISADITGLTEQFRPLSVPIPVQFNGRIQSPSADVEALLDQFQQWQDAAAAADTLSAAGPPSLAFRRIEGSLDARVDAYSYGDVRGRQFVGKVVLRERAMTISGDTEAMGGSFNLEGELSWGSKTLWEGALTCVGVDVREAFRQSRNFGQDFITKDHLKGRLSTQLVFSAEWDEQGAFRPEQLRLYAALQIDEGELVQMKVLESFSDYVHVRDLRQVRFHTLQNYLEVSGGKVYLPRMLIQSNAMVLDITGLHGFDQSIDYGIRVDAGQVMMNKLTRHDASLAPKPAKRNGWFNLYYHIQGNVDNFRIKSDKGRVKDDFQRSAYHRERIRKVLEDEFGRLLFTEGQDEEVEVADNRAIPAAEPGAPAPVAETLRPALRPEIRQPAARNSDPEYLEDIEIIGGSGKRKQ